MNKQLTIWQEKPNPTVLVHNPIVFGQLAAMDVTAMRLFLLMLAKWDVNAPVEEEIKIQFKELIPNYAGHNGSQYKLICESLIQLKEKIKDIRVEEIRNGIRTFKVMTVLDSLEFTEDRSYIIGRFAIKIRDYLKNLKGHFTIAELKEIFVLRSYHAIRLFLIGKSFHDGMSEVKLTLDEFKMILGIDPESHKQYKFLKRDVINVGIKALSQTSAAIEIKEKKNGKNVVGLIIKPAKPIKKKVNESTTLLFSLAVENLFKNYDVNQSKVIELFKAGEISEKYIDFVFAKFRNEPIDRKTASIIHAGIVKKKYWTEFINAQPKEEVYKPHKKVVQNQGFITTFHPDTELKEIHKEYYNQAIEAMIADGFFWTEKKGIIGLGKY